MPQFYHIEETSSLTQLIEEIDTIQAKINAQKPLQEALWATIQEKLRIEWTYDSNVLVRKQINQRHTRHII